ncbi:MAG: excinuclease ABC subunit UvrC [Cardiobacteriaceae bacterium]|nr:excinuclease ABC subunit UvrC [Cardiobacteriaceae bacterium]
METRRHFDPRIFLTHVSQQAGVYQMRNREGKVLYVGKAKNLKKRLASYFREDLSPKTRALMSQVVDISTTITSNELEALILESNLIKAHQPKYNILLKDDKSYPYIALSAHAFPRLMLARIGMNHRQTGEYFGPYPNVQAARSALEMLQKLFRIRPCEDSVFNSRTRPCLQYQIARCTAPCVGYIETSDYRDSLQDMRAFLQGKNDELIRHLTEKMMRHSEAERYEQAAICRDQIQLLRQLTQHQFAIAGHADVDVLAVAIDYGEACVYAQFYRNGHNVGRESYFPHLPEEASEEQVLSAFIAQFYDRRPAPPLLLLSQPLPQDAQSALEQLLTQRVKDKGLEYSVVIHHQARAEKRQFLESTLNNAKHSLALRLSNQLSMQKRFVALAEAFGLARVPKRLECIDISHTQGSDTMASCVVFDERGAVKSDYRLFKLKDIASGDDYAAMAQVVERRLLRLEREASEKEQSALPDILFIDGGRGQVNAALAVVEKLALSKSIQIIGVSKGLGRKAGLEQFWLPEMKQTKTWQPMHLPSNSLAMHLILHIRDEAHRFAIGAHRQARTKTSHQSRLSQIKGVGAKRRQALLKHFGGLEGVMKASAKDLAMVEGISLTLAENIFEALHPI